MPIISRDAGEAIPVKPKVYKPDPDAKFKGDTISSTEGFFAYGYDAANPLDVPVDDLVSMLRIVQNTGERLETEYRNRIKGRLSAIRAFCVLNKGSAKKVRTCDNVSCPLWAFRMGNNPFRRKK